MNIKLRPLHEGDLDQAFILTQQLKWPHRRDDWQQALQLGEGMAVERDGELIGTALCWRWGSDYATLGLVIVADATQGQGVGKRLLLAMLDKLAGSNVRLHATEAGKGLYKKLGFVTMGQVQQHQCRELAAVTAVLPAAGQQLRAAQVGDVESLTTLDHQAHGQYRPQLIAELISSAERVLVLEQDGDISGFASVRRFGHGYAIGPVIAANLPQAILLVSQLLSNLTGQFVRMDSDAASGLGDWLSAQGLVVVDAPTIMVKGTAWQPVADGAQVFGLMSQAMG